ncbi:MAG TPA: BlaI/MecI/CopY family transcriptional regulator [Pirellulales bacterium]
MARKSARNDRPNDKPLDSLGDLQAAVMETVWRLGEATVQQVRDELAKTKALAYTTVLSAMQKLEKAGWLAHRSDSRTYIYFASRSRRQAEESALKQFTRRVFRGDPLKLFQHLLDDERLADEDLAELRKQIDRRRKERRDE